MLAGANDPLGRSSGDRLWPEWFTDDQVQTARLDVRAWNALYQQDPSPEDGEYFKREWFNEYDRSPAGHLYGASDYAVSEGMGDYSEHGIFELDFNGDLYIRDWWRGQTKSDEWIERQCDLIAAYSPLIWFGEKGVIQKAIEPALKRRMQERNTLCRLEWLPEHHGQVRACAPVPSSRCHGECLYPESCLLATRSDVSVNEIPCWQIR